MSEVARLVQAQVEVDGLRAAPPDGDCVLRVLQKARGGTTACVPGDPERIATN